MTSLAHRYPCMSHTDHVGVGELCKPHEFLENNLKYDYCLVTVPATAVVFLTVNAGRSEEIVECIWYSLKTPCAQRLKLN